MSPFEANREKQALERFKIVRAEADRAMGENESVTYDRESGEKLVAGNDIPCALGIFDPVGNDGAEQSREA